MLKLIFSFGLLFSTFAAALPSDDLLGYWTLDDNLSDTAPSGTADTGSWQGGTSYSATDSRFGSAITLDGSNFISIPSSDDLVHVGGSVSISVWFKVDVFDTRWQCLLSKGDTSEYRLARRATNDNALSYAGGSGDIFGGSVNDGEWHHAFAISDAGENTALYIDGELIATGAAPSITDEGLPLYLGENPGAVDRRWKGGIDDVALFGEALREQQALAVYHFASLYDYPMADVIQILDAHDLQSSVAIGSDTWAYKANDPGTGTFVALGTDGSGVDISNAPSITSFESDPLFINSSESAVLSWQVSPPFTAISIDKGIGSVLAETDVNGAGSVSVSPTVTTVYTLSATNSDGTNSIETTLFVDVDPSTPRINEFVANSSSNGLQDEDGDTSDWIELYNPGPFAADLSTYYLTDDETLLNKWAFPAIMMEPDSYLVVFASSKNRAPTTGELHTNFSLSAGGEFLALTEDDGNGGFAIIASDLAPNYPPQEEGFSYGLDTDGATEGYLAPPTPNSANGSAGLGFVADTSFDVDRGFFTSPFNLTITSLTPDAEIRYTTDGSEPTTTNGFDYSNPINISATTTIRAAAFKEGFIETNVDTHTYFFLEDVRTQLANGAAPAGWPSNAVNNQIFNYGMDPDITSRYTAQEMTEALSAIPSVSITVDQEDLTGGAQGIYVNPNGRGRSWERKASLEIIHPDGTTSNVQSECGLRIRGGASRNTSNPKHAFRLFFRGEYGDSKLNYPLFGAEGVDEFDKIDLRTAQNYSWSFANGGAGANTFLREILGRDLQGSFEHPHTRSRYYHLYLNGIYWGLFMTQERAEANFGADYLGGNPDDYDTVKSAGNSGGYDTEATDGSIGPGSDWETLWNLARAQEASPTIDRFMEMQGLNPDGSRNPALPVYLDVNNLIEYQMIIGYTGNYDSAQSAFGSANSNNWYGLRNRESDDFGFQFFVHDGEHSLGAGGRWGANNDRMNTTNGFNGRDFV